MAPRRMAARSRLFPRRRHQAILPVSPLAPSLPVPGHRDRPRDQPGGRDPRARRHRRGHHLPSHRQACAGRIRVDRPTAPPGPPRPAPPRRRRGRAPTHRTRLSRISHRFIVDGHPRYGLGGLLGLDCRLSERARMQKLPNKCQPPRVLTPVQMMISLRLGPIASTSLRETNLCLPCAAPSPRPPRPGRERCRRPRGPGTARSDSGRRPGRCRRNEPGTSPPCCRASPWPPSWRRLLRTGDRKRRRDALPRTSNRRSAHGWHSRPDAARRGNGNGCGTAARNTEAGSVGDGREDRATVSHDRDWTGYPTRKQSIFRRPRWV